MSKSSLLNSYSFEEAVVRAMQVPMRTDPIDLQKVQDSMTMNKNQLGKRHRRLAFQESEEDRYLSFSVEEQKDDGLSGCKLKR